MHGKTRRERARGVEAQRWITTEGSGVGDYQTRHVRTVRARQEGRPKRRHSTRYREWRACMVHERGRRGSGTEYAA